MYVKRNITKIVPYNATLALSDPTFNFKNFELWPFIKNV